MRRLNYRLSEACHDTITEKCADTCSTQGFEQPCGGTVLRCLTSKLDEITNEACKKEVRRLALALCTDLAKQACGPLTSWAGC